MTTAVDILAAGGPVAASLPNYERRNEQLAMARAVESAFADNEHLLVEAGTGVGKSFAYLVPAILAIRQRRRVVVSTYTIALQEQLMGKDLPLLRRATGLEFRAVLAKGRNNYLCRRRLDVATRRADRLLGSAKQIAQLARLADWADATAAGSRQDITFAVDDAVWRRVQAESGSCAGRKCKWFPRCHFHDARRRVQKADLLVVNHALLLSDLALRWRSEGAAGELLGAFDLLVLDEAQNLEAIASDHFGTSVTSGAVQAMVRDLHNQRNDRGVLSLAADREAIRAASNAARAAEAFFDDLADAGPPAVAASGRIGGPNVVVNNLSPALRDLAGHLKRVRSAGADPSYRLEIQSYELRCGDLADAIDALVGQAREGYAYWRTVRRFGDADAPAPRFGRGRAGRYVILACAPIDVAPILKGALFETVNSVVLTSATLTTGRTGVGGFDYVRSRLGVEEARELRVDSPFDFRRQARLYVETRLGDPNDLSRFLPRAVRAIEHYVGKSRGRCFVLFTSYRMLAAAAEALADFTDRDGYRLLVQGGPLPRSAMLDAFRRDGR